MTTPSEPSPNEIYGKDYFDEPGRLGPSAYTREEPVWMEHFALLAKRIVETLGPKTVMDVGCAKGFLVEHLRDCGVDAWGRDISEYAVSQVRDDIKPFCEVTSAWAPLPQHYDLITCIEVAEHLSAEDGKRTIDRLCEKSDLVLFSSTPSDFTEPTHINVQPPEYWQALFAGHEFYPDLNFNADFVTPHAVLFRRQKTAKIKVAVFSHEPPTCAVALLRLAGIIRTLEEAGRMELCYVTAKDVEFDMAAVLASDIFVIHREFADKRYCKNIVKAARDLGKIVVFELDDLLINVPHSNPNHQYCQSITPDILDMVIDADFITVTTEPLRRELEEVRPEAKGKIHVLPNYINLDIWGGGQPASEQRSGPVVIGWFGTATHDEDLAVIKPAIIQIAKKYAGKVIFKFWGYLPKDLEGIEGVVMARASQPNIKLHARDVVNSQIDLAIAPLIDHPFNHSKSNLKWLEYSICYFPGIYSRITPYTDFVTHGETGWIVDNTTEAWVEAMEKFINDAALRRRIALQAYQAVRSNYCLDVGSRRWDTVYRAFSVSSPRQKKNPDLSPEISLQHARAALLGYKGNVMAVHGKITEAAGFFNQAVSEYSRQDAWLEGIFGNVHAMYQYVLASRPTINPARPLIDAGKILAAKHPSEAVETFLKALKTAEQTNNASYILETLLLAGSELISLDPKRAQQILQMGLQLAENIKAPKAIDQAKELLGKLKNPRSNRAAPPSSAADGSAQAARPAPKSSVKTAPAVSIVIPTFNKLQLTKRCLKLIQENTPVESCEIIVVDNGSTDGTAQFLKQEQSAGRLRALLNSKNQGFAKACNHGSRAARAEAVLFLNNDTEVQPNWLDPLLAVLQDVNVAAVGGKLLFPDGSIQHAGVALAEAKGLDPLVAFHLYAKEKSDHPAANERRCSSALTAACLLVRKKMFDAVGGFDEGYWNGYEDVDLCLKFQERGWLSIYEPQSVVVHLESQSGPERYRKVQENIRRLHSKWIGKIKPDIVIEPGQPFPPKEIPSAHPYTLIAAPVQTGIISSTAPQRVEHSLVSIIILAHNQLDHTRKCLASLHAHTSAPCEIIFVDNGSTDGTADFVRAQARTHSHIHLIVNPTNRGFAAGNNQALAIAKGDYLVLLNNDTVVTHGWLEGLISVLDKHPEAGLVGPVSNFVSGPQLVPDADYKTLDEMAAFAADWHARHTGQSVPAVRLVGFCLMARKAVIDRIGGLDEAFGSGNFEDDDFCLRAGLAGFQARIAVATFIHHTGSQTFKGARIDYRASMLRNWEIFKRKWGIPADAPVETGYRLPLQLTNPQALKFPLPLSIIPDAGSEARISASAVPKVPDSNGSQLPAVAMLGDLTTARNYLARQDYQAAWQTAVEAIRVRPFHPVAHLLLGQIALAAGDISTARQCGERARLLVPNWKPARKFLKDLPVTGKKSAVSWPSAPERLSAPRLSVCLIVKNEEQFIGQALKSIQEVAHQIIVLDTGSSDRTVEIARSLGAEVHAFDWCDDFSAARNAALTYATGDWILSLDADEELLPEGRDRLLKEIRDVHVFAYRMPLMDVNKQNDGVGYVPRLFRNAPGLYFTGIIHEQIFHQVEILRKEWGLDNKLGTATLLHHGYTKEIAASRNKNDRNLRLLERAVQQSPKDSNLVMNLGLELVKAGRLEEGIARYQEAFALMSALPSSDVPPELREVLMTQLGVHLMAAQRYEEVLELWRSPLSRSVTPTASIHFTLGLAHLKLKNFQRAIDEMHQCIAKRTRPTLSPGLPEIRKSRPHHCIAECQWALGKTAEALQAFEEALQDDPKSKPARFDYARFLADHGQPVEALKMLHQLVEENAGDAIVWQLGGTIALSRADFLEFACDWTAEAIKAFPNDKNMRDQRAQALLLSQNCEQAQETWKSLATEQNPRALAALIICDVVTGSSPSEFASSAETRVSQEFLKWYRLLIQFEAHQILEPLNNRLILLRETIPTAVKVLETALAEANEAVTP